jgi:hypothetical protein
MTQLQSNEFALRHYNTAIRELRQAKHEPLVLLTCLLFICIEVIQDNKDQAVLHCQHGMAILNNIKSTAVWSQDYLAPIFHRLRLVPVFFGGGNTTRISGLPEAVPTYFASFEEANCFIEDAIARTMELTRHGDEYRYGSLVGQRVRPDLLASRKKLIHSLATLRSALTILKKQHLEKPHCYSVEKETWCLMFELRVTAATIWAAVTFNPSESAYDRFIDGFQHMISVATLLNKGMAHRVEDLGPEFRLEIGYLVMIYVTILKCRRLQVRLQALELLKLYGAVKESFWDSKKMYRTSRRVVEIEHNLKLDRLDRPIGPVSWVTLPEETERIYDTTFNAEVVTEAEVEGRPMTGNPLGYIRRNAEGQFWVQNEFIFVKSVSNSIRFHVYLSDNTKDSPMQTDRNRRPQFMALDQTQARPYHYEVNFTHMKCPLV